MANTLSVIDMVATQALKIAHEKATFIGTVSRQYDDQFAKTGAKIGATLRVRNPNAYTRRKGSRVMDVQDSTETTQTITVATQDGVDIRFNSAELSEDIDYITERYIEPAVSSLVSGIDSDMITLFTEGVYNTTGTAGTVVGTSADLSALYNARAKLNQGLAPKDKNRAIQLDSVTMSSVVNGNKAIFNPTEDVSDAFREGFYARSAMADFYENERTWTLTNISDVTGTTESSSALNTADTAGGYTGVDMHTTVVSPAVGAVFTIAGVYACHPETKQSYGSLQQFVVTVTSASTFCTVSPEIFLSGARQNVVNSSNTSLAVTDFNSQTLTFWGSASTSYRQNVMYHQDSFAFVTADLPLMDDAIKCTRMSKDGLSLRVWQASDIRNDEMLMRIDILYGGKILRPEWACRISN